MYALTTINLCIEHSSQCSLKKKKSKAALKLKKSKTVFIHKWHSCLYRKSYGIYQKGKILINEFYMVAGYKISIQNQLYSSIVTQTSRNWNKNTALNRIKKYKIQRYQLDKKFGRYVHWNYKAFLRKILKSLNNWRDTTLLDQKTQ